VRLFRGRRPEPDFSDDRWWDSRQRELRENEVKTQKRASVAQIGTTVVAIGAAIVAGIAAWQAGNAAETAGDVAKEGVRRTADESRLKTATDAMGADLPAQRVAGFTFLTRHATQRLESANEGNATETERRDALRLYRGTVDILVNYLINPGPSSLSETSLQPTNPEPAQRGVGDPKLPRDYHYAAGRLRELLQHKADYLELSAVEGDPSRPTMDLANTILYGVRWKNTDFSWLEARYLPGADLRRAKLDDSKWQGSTFTDAYMQCVQLQGANLAGARLEGAHFEGANLKGANLTGANLTGAHLEGAQFNGAMLHGAVFTGAKLEQGTLDSAKRVDQAIDVNEQASLTDETRSDLEC
jgi:hypothetical protein